MFYLDHWCFLSPRAEAPIQYRAPSVDETELENVFTSSPRHFLSGVFPADTSYRRRKSAAVNHATFIRQQ